MTVRIHASPVLVIDDSLTIRKLLEMALDRAGHPFEVAGQAKEGLALAKRVQPKLILLDYVLPDLKGSEVCDALAADPATASIPVVVMSGKGEDIRPLFRNRQMVVDVIAKPFSPAEILHVINRALGKSSKGTEQITARQAPRQGTSSYSASTTYSTASTIAPPPSDALEPKPRPLPQAVPTTSIILSPTSRDAKEAAAKVVFGLLKERLARIPEWSAELGVQPAAPFYAKKIITPDVVGGLLQGLAPLMIAEAPLTPPATEIMVGPPGEPPSDFTGSTGFLPLPQLFRLIAETHRTGELRLGASPGVSVFIERGRLRLAAPRDLASGERIASALGTPVPPDVLDAWEAQERDGGLPPAVAAAALDGSGEAAASELNRLGRQALVHLGTQGPMTYAWKDQDPLPAEVTRLGQDISLEQLTLDRLRQVDDWSQIELDVRSLDQRCLRTPGFAVLLPRIQLTADEEKVLLHVNGRNRVKDILEHSKLSTFDVFHILYRMIQLRLVVTAGAESTPAASQGVLLCAAGDSGLAGALERWLATRGDGTPLVSCTTDDAIDGILTHRPRLVVVDIADEGPDPRQLARQVRAKLAVADVPLVAVTGRTDAGHIRPLLAAGFDRVLSTPIHAHDLARCLANGPWEMP